MQTKPSLMCHGLSCIHRLSPLQNSSLQINFEDAIAQVTQLQGMTFELEGRLHEDEKSHQEVVASRDDEIDVLNERVSMMALWQWTVCCILF